MFAIREGKDWRPVSYEMDIARYIDWTHIDISHFDRFPLTEGETCDFEGIVGLGEDLYGRDAFVRRITHERIFSGMVIYDPTFLARHLCEDIIPNPWTAYELGRKILDKLMGQHGKEKVVANFVYLVQEAKRHFIKQKNELARNIFETMMVEDRMRFIVIADGFDINRPRTVKETTLLNKKNGKPLQRSLFEPIMEDEFDTQTEREVAYFLEEQENLFWWYRNIPKQDYYVQGWQKGRIYPDLIFTRRTGEGNDHAKVFVVELKGVFLDNPDTAYKQAVFEICNEQAVKHTDLGTLHRTFNQRHTKFKLIFDNEWQQRLTEFLQ
jgi:type III restriction enzyme